METILSRHKNVVVLVAALLLQFLLLAVQIRRETEHGSVRLIRIVTIRTITPIEKGIVHTRDFFADTWHNYINLRWLRHRNEELEEENARLRMDQVRMVQDASQARRLQALLKFKEQFVSATVAAQVIGTSGTEQSRLLYIDKGSDDGLAPDMAVITTTGVVGKIVRVQPGTAQVLEINDQTSGIGAILEKSRLQGILKGTPSGDAMLHYIMSDEKIEVGEMVLTSGGDRIFPKGLPIGRVMSVNPGSDLFLNIRVKPSALLNRIEEVLVITKIDERQPDLLPEGPQRAADILAARLPSIPVKPPEATPAQPGTANAQAQAAGSQPAPGQTQQNAPKPAGAAGTGAAPKPQGTGTAQAKPQDGAPAGQTGTRPAQGTPGASAGTAVKPATQSNATAPTVKRTTETQSGNTAAGPAKKPTGDTQQH